MSERKKKPERRQKENERRRAEGRARRQAKRKGHSGPVTVSCNGQQWLLTV